MEIIFKHRFASILIITLFVSVLIDSPLLYRHYENLPILIYFLIAYSLCLLFIFPSSKFIIAEKIIYSAPIACAGLLCSTMLSEAILGSIFGIDGNFDTVQSPAGVTNFVFYFLSGVTSIGMFAIWNKLKDEIYN